MGTVSASEIIRSLALALRGVRVPRMIEWLAVWLGAQAAGFVFRPILEELAMDVAKDWTKDFCMQSLRSKFRGRDEWAKAVGKALAEFLLQYEQELIGVGAAQASVRR